MSQIEPDSILQRHLTPDPGEPVLAEFRADRAIYWKGHVIMAVVLGTLAGLTLVYLGNPYPVMGPVGAALAIAGHQHIAVRREAVSLLKQKRIGGGAVFEAGDRKVVVPEVHGGQFT